MLFVVNFIPLVFYYIVGSLVFYFMSYVVILFTYSLKEQTKYTDLAVYSLYFNMLCISIINTLNVYNEPRVRRIYPQQFSIDNNQGLNYLLTIILLLFCLLFFAELKKY